jgi:hypothetical protein
VVGAREHVINVLTEEQSRDVLARCSGTEVAKLGSVAEDLVRECGGLPLALSMVGAMLRGKPSSLWKRAVELLRRADLDKIKAQFPHYPYTDILRAIQVSIDALDAGLRERYIALAVMPEDMAIAPEIQECLWGVDEVEAVDNAEQFVSLSLAQRDEPEGSLRLHDLQLDYVRSQYPYKEALELIRSAVRLSSGTIRQDPSLFASQMVGRLLPYGDLSGIQRFLAKVVEGARSPWLRPLQPGLHPPGTGLVRTLEGHSDSVNAVAVTPDGRRAVSASEDNTLKVWDLESGQELRTLEGHSDPVNAVVVTPDGRRAVSLLMTKR